MSDIEISHRFRGKTFKGQKILYSETWLTRTAGTQWSHVTSDGKHHLATDTWTGEWKDEHKAMMKSE